MLGSDSHRKVTASHLRREAFLYVRQSTLKQVIENVESKQRQYALRDRAVALGWGHDRIRTIDRDLGQSSAISEVREGFKTLVSEVGLGHAGIVMGLEVSRLARNSTEWHRLVEICALTDTLILDEDGVYDPAQFNDRLLLGLKGTLSEAELHVLRARLRGGILNKASRGELGMRLPIGLGYDPAGKVCLDPDMQIQKAVQLLFDTFSRTASAHASVRFFRAQGLRFPRRTTSGGNKGDVVWQELKHSRVLAVLHNPRYAGAFAYGRSTYRKDASGKTKGKRKPTDEWTFLIKNSHAGYISWEDYERNLRLLLNNAEAHGLQRCKGPPREGLALLQGMVLCGCCGRRMTIRYYTRNGSNTPIYVCQSEGIQSASPICQTIHGSTIDAAIGSLLMESVSPMNVESAFRVQEEIKRRLDEADSIRKKDVERAQFEVDLARRRYMQVDPSNRLVADTLEADWNEKLRALRATQDTYEKHRQEDSKRFSEEKKAEIMALTSSFPRLWNDPSTSDRDRKRMARLLIEDVTLSKDDHLHLGVRFRGGATKELTLPLPKTAFESWKTGSQIVKDINRLLDTHSDQEIADYFNSDGIKTGKGHVFTQSRINRIRQIYNLPSRFDRLRAKGWLTRQELSNKLGANGQTILRWAKEGRLETIFYKKKLRLYADPGENGPKPMSHASRGRCRHAKSKSMSLSIQ